MSFQKPRGIAVVDAGATNTKIVLFDGSGNPLAERKSASRHVEGPPYRHIDTPVVCVGWSHSCKPTRDGRDPYFSGRIST